MTNSNNLTIYGVIITQFLGCLTTISMQNLSSMELNRRMIIMLIDEYLEGGEEPG
jgi:hypothetical protein